MNDSELRDLERRRKETGSIDLLHLLSTPTAEGHGRIVAAVSAESIPWLLGAGDPVRERARARAS